MQTSNRLAKFTYFSLGVVSAIFVIEALLHTIENTPLWRALPVVERELGLPDPDIGYRFRTNHEIINIRENRARVSTNSLGMRDKERTVDKPVDTVRVAMMGDSFTEALQVDLPDTFTMQTEDQLNATTPHGVNNSTRYEVLNFGMSGFGPLQQLLHYEKNALAFAPDLILFVVGINDFLSAEMSNDANGPAYIENAKGDLQIGQAFHNLTSHRIVDSFVGQLFFWAMDYSRLARAAYLKFRVGNSSTEANFSTATSCKRYSEQLGAQTKLWSALQPRPSGDRLEKLLSDVSGINADTTMPKPITLALYGLDMPAPKCEPELATREKLISVITEKMSEYSITFLDLEHGLAESDKQRYLNHEFQGFGTALGHGHLNERGHKAFANILTKHIIQLLN